LPTTTSKPTKSVIKILYAETHEQVVATNAAEMQKAGHHVTTALSRAEVQQQLRHDAFDLVILGSTMSKDDRHHLPYMVKKAHEGTKVLVMHAGTHHHEVEMAVDSGISMVLLLERIAALLQPVGVH